MTDSLLIERVKNGDQRAFEVLYNRHNFRLQCMLNKAV
jgi:hypothetical protein